MKTHYTYSDKQKQENRMKYLFTSVALFAFLSSLVVLLVFLNQKPQEKAKAKLPTIALVNEDLPSTFNKKEYNFGKNFIDIASNDNKFNWQVVSRSVADKAYLDSSVDAVIYLPQTFSKDLLTLQDILPTKTEVGYKVKPQSDELSGKILQDKITSVLYDFNQNVVKMYYASVAGNIAEAENQMNATVGKQENLVTNLSIQVQNPFQASLPGYSTFISGTSSLKGMNQANVSMQNSFTESTKTLMKQTGESFSSQLPQIKSLFDTQKKIAEINATNANKGITNQTESDQAFYYNQFDNFHTDTQNRFKLFVKQDEDGNETGIFVDLQGKAQNYNQMIDGVRGNISEQIATLTSKRDELLGLENELYQQFFSQEIAVTLEDFEQFSDTQNEENARKALAEKLQSSLGQNDIFSGSGYLGNLHQLIAELSLNPNDYKLNELRANDTILDDKKLEIRPKSE